MDFRHWGAGTTELRVSIYIHRVHTYSTPKKKTVSEGIHVDM